MTRTITFTEAQLVEIEQRARATSPVDADMPERLHRKIGEDASEAVYDWLSTFHYDTDQIKQDIELLVEFVRQASRERGE